MTTESVADRQANLRQSESNLIKILTGGRAVSATDLERAHQNQIDNGSLVFSPKAALALCEYAQLSDNEWRELSSLASSDESAKRARLHQFLSFVKMYAESLLNITPNNKEYEKYERISNDESWGRETFTTALIEMLSTAAINSKNFLMDAHIQDTVDAFALWKHSKESALSGVPGGSRDDIIYAHKHLRTSYDLRRRIGFYDGYLIAQTVLPFSKGVAAVYRDFSPHEILPILEVSNDHQLAEEDSKYILENSEEHEWIYSSLNVHVPRSGGNRFDSNGLEKLRALWDLDKDLKRLNEEFYFDVTKIDENNLHPFVFADILHRNFEFLKKRHDTRARAQSIDPLLEKSGIVAKNEYLLLTSLSIRKKVEERLNIDFAQLTARELKGLLFFLEKTTLEELDGLQDFFDTYGMNGARTFLAASVDPVVEKEIIEFAGASEQLAVKRVFAAFGHFADTVESLESYLIKTFGLAEADVIREATQRILERGRALLRNAHTYKNNPEALEILLDSLDTEQRILGDLIPLYLKRGYDLKDFLGIKTIAVKGGELKGHVRAEVHKMHRAGYEKNPEYSPGQIDNLAHELDVRMNSPHSEFKIVVEADKEKPMAALRFDYTYDAQDPHKVMGIFLASVMASDSVSGSRIGLLHTEAQIRAQMETYGGIPIGAVCNPAVPITTKYLDMGFVVTDVIYSSNDKPFFRIELSQERNKKLPLGDARSLSESVIAERVDLSAAVPSKRVIYHKPASISEIIEKFKSLKSENSNWCITRYFVDKKSSKTENARYYAIFELPE